MNRYNLQQPKHGIQGTEWEKLWYVATQWAREKGETDRYLHTDGTVHPSVCFDGEYTGYFKTRQAARNAKLAYEVGGDDD